MKQMVNPINNGYALLPSSGCAATPIAPWTLDVRGIAVRDAAVDAVAAKTDEVCAVAPMRERTIAAAATGHFGVLAGTRPGLPSWSPPS